MIRFLRRALGYVKRRLRPPPKSASTEYEVIESPAQGGADGWRTASIAERQHEAFEPLLREAREGRPRIDFQAAAKAVEETGLATPSLVEVGCGSGYYSEVLPLLLGRPLRYLGVDYSPHMVALARRSYPGTSFVTGDARALPLEDASFDIVLSGASLMHIVEYERAIAESVRVAREWCIFHTVTVLERRATTLLRKRAYGEPVMEVVFNRGELERTFAALGLRVAAVHDSIPYDLFESVGERTHTLTYLCQKTS